MRGKGRFVLLLAITFGLAFLFGACAGKGARQTPIIIPPTTQTIAPDKDTSIILPSGGGAFFPAGSVSTSTPVTVTEVLSGEQRDPAGFPVGSGAMLGATVIALPSGSVLAKDISVFIALKEAQAPGVAFTIFSFNSSTHMWESTQTTSSLRNTSAVGVVGSNGEIVSFTAPTAGKGGTFAFAVFENFKSEAPGPGPGPVNQIPSVSLSADKETADPSETVTLTATGSDPDGDTLTFSWLAPGGTLSTPTTSGGTSTATWSSANPGVYVISVSVSDGKGGVATDAVTVTVVQPGVENNPPTFGQTGISSDVSAPVATQKVIFSATATDPDGDTLSYDWSDSSGGSNFFDTSVDETGKATASWRIDTPGTYTITVTATDGKGGSAQATYDVTVAPLPTEFNWMGYEYCAPCHNTESYDFIVDGWKTTAHSTAMDTIRGIGMGRNEACYNCHNVGYFPTGRGGWIDEELTPQFEDIQCENCHGSGKGHPASGPLPEPWDPGTGYQKDANGNYIVVDGAYQYDETYDGSNGYGCGLCHEGPRHGAFEEWAESGHATFALYGEDGVTPEHNVVGAGCVMCHNGKYYVKVQIEGEAPPAEDLTEVNEDSAHITCAVCHDPHSGEYEYQLRVDPETNVVIPFGNTSVSGGPANICITCHNGRRTEADRDNFIAGNTFRGMHPNNQGTMLFAIGGFEFPGYEYDKEHPHNTWNEEKCVTCHMWTKEYESPESPGVFGHTFEPRVEACLTCHVGTPEEFEAYEDAFVDEVTALMAEFVQKYPFKDMTDPQNPVLLIRPQDGGPPADEIGNQYRQAAWNYLYVEEDGSLGRHNPEYALDLLKSAIAKLDELNAGAG